MSTRTLVQLLEKLQRDPSTRDWAEVFEQLVHQWSLGTASYAAFPYLVEYAVEQQIQRRPEFLVDAGRVATPIERYGPCPDDLRGDFENAIRCAREIAMAAARESGYSSQDYVYVLQAAAALSGRRGPGIRLVETLGTMQPAVGFECPGCQLDLVEEFTSGGSAYILVNGPQLEAKFDRVLVAPNRPQCSLAISQDLDDFSWLVNFCRSSGHGEVLEWLCQLYGNSHCPACHARFNVMSEIQSDVMDESF